MKHRHHPPHGVDAEGQAMLRMAPPVTSDPWELEEHQLEELLNHQAHQDTRMSRIEYKH